MEPRFQPGDKVGIITLYDGLGRKDPRAEEWTGRTGEIAGWYYASFSEVWEKTLKPVDTYCYDVRLDGSGEIVRGIPEAGLEASPFSVKE
jgi:hypothetical protein